MTTAIHVCRRVAECRALIVTMAQRQLRSRFAGTAGGMAWSFIAPLATMLVYWFVFSVGLRVQPVGDLPFIAVFASAFVPWLSFSEAVMAGTGSITENSHLVKKCVFPVETLPVVSVAAGLVTHGCMLVILVVILLVNGITPTASLLQLPYYLFALLVLTTGMAWITSALNVLLRDTREVLNVLFNLWFWVTPIVWPLSMVPERFAWVFRLNPMFYVVEGYRASFLGGEPFWATPTEALQFWCVAFAVLFGGAALFGRARNEFAEVL